MAANRMYLYCTVCDEYCYFVQQATDAWHTHAHTGADLETHIEAFFMEHNHCDGSWLSVGGGTHFRLAYEHGEPEVPHNAKYFKRQAGAA